MEALENRIFRVWDYSVSHDRLLVRSSWNVEHPKNLDLVFAGVDCMHLGTLLHGVRLCEPNEADAQAATALSGREVATPLRQFVLESQGTRYFVVASSLLIEETEGSSSSLDRLT